MATIPADITKDDVLNAIAALDRNEPHEFGDSTGYDLIFEGRRYPPKAVLGLAARRSLGQPLGPYDFKGGEKSQCFRILRGLGFVIEPKSGTQIGDDWTEDECRELVEDYFSMLAKDVAGVSFVKAEHRRRLFERLNGRTEKAIEYKYRNVSGVLADLGFPYLRGYVPARNYQRRLLSEIVLEHMGSRQQEVAKIEHAMEAVPDAPPGRLTFEKSEVAAPEREEPQGSDDAPAVVRRARKFDFASRDAANRRLGRAGEEFVVERERWYLTSVGRPDLAKQVEWVAETRGDGLGYDVRSFEPQDDSEIYIEVKTTNGGRDAPFLLTANEINASAALGQSFRLYRVFRLSTAPQFYQVKGNLADVFSLKPRVFEARR